VILSLWKKKLKEAPHSALSLSIREKAVPDRAFSSSDSRKVRDSWFKMNRKSRF
jgi:hypothetical protein